MQTESTSHPFAGRLLFRSESRQLRKKKRTGGGVGGQVGDCASARRRRVFRLISVRCGTPRSVPPPHSTPPLFYVSTVEKNLFYTRSIARRKTSIARSCSRREPTLPLDSFGFLWRPTGGHERTTRKRKWTGTRLQFQKDRTSNHLKIL